MPGGDNSVQTYGAEAPSAERSAANTVLLDYLSAYGAGRFSRACAQMASALRASIERYSSGSSASRPAGCTAALRAISAGAPPAARRVDAATSPIAALRLRGASGFALYHGHGHAGYFMPMVREGGRWRVGALAATEIQR